MVNPLRSTVARHCRAQRTTRLAVLRTTVPTLERAGPTLHECGASHRRRVQRGSRCCISMRAVRGKSGRSLRVWRRIVIHCAAGGHRTDRSDLEILGGARLPLTCAPTRRSARLIAAGRVARHRSVLIDPVRGVRRPRSAGASSQGLDRKSGADESKVASEFIRVVAELRRRLRTTWTTCVACCSLIRSRSDALCFARQSRRLAVSD